MVTFHQLVRTQIRCFHFELHEEAPHAWGTGAAFRDEYGMEFSCNLNLVVNDKAEPGIAIQLGVKLLPAEGSRSRFKTFSMEAEGLVVVPRSVPADFVTDDFIRNCCSLLYGTMRGQASVLTGLVRGGPMMLPAIDINEAITVQLEGLVGPLRQILAAEPGKTTIRSRKTPKAKQT